MKAQLSCVINAKQIKNRSFFLIGGSWRAIAKIHMQRTKYPLKIIQGYEVEVRKLKKTLKFIRDRSFLSQCDEINIPFERLELLPHSASLLELIIEKIQCETVTFSSFGVREGFIYEQLSAAEKKRDPLIDAAKFF